VSARSSTGVNVETNAGMSAAWMFSADAHAAARLPSAWSAATSFCPSQLGMAGLRA